MRFSQKLRNLVLVSIDDLREVVHGLFKESIIGSLTSIFSAKAGPIWKKIGKLLQSDMSTAVIWSKLKPDVRF